MKKHLSSIIAGIVAALLIACTIIDCNVKKANEPYVPTEKEAAESEKLNGFFTTHIEGVNWGISYDDFVKEHSVMEGTQVYSEGGVSAEMQDYVVIDGVKCVMTVKFDNNAGLYEVIGKFEEAWYDTMKKGMKKELGKFLKVSENEDIMEFASPLIGEYYSQQKLAEAYQKAYPDDPSGPVMGQLIASSNEFSAILKAEGTFDISAIRYLALKEIMK